VQADDLCGCCPECGCNDGYFNIGRVHWFVCHEHKNKWQMGANLFGTWKREDTATWTDNDGFLQSYREVLPSGSGTNLLPQRPSIARAPVSTKSK
jgi:hypothetical protein